jgi:hypothetical protein
MVTEAALWSFAGASSQMSLSTNIAGKALYSIQITSSYEQLAGDQQLGTAEWTHFVVALSAPEGVFYINGEVVASSSDFELTPGDLGFTGSNYLGRSASGVYLDADIDDFRIYDRVLTQVDVLALATMGE